MVLVFLEQKDGKIKKSSLEAASFAADIAAAVGSKVVGLIINGVKNLSELGLYGVDVVYEYHATDYLDTQQWVQILSQAISILKSDYLVLSNNSLGGSKQF